MESEFFITNKCDKFPIDKTSTNLTVHGLVWHNNTTELRKYLSDFKDEYNLETKDPHGRTPLHLAISLGHLESSRILLEYGASALAENSRNWTVVQEAVSTGDPDMLKLCLEYRDHQRHLNRLTSLPSLLKALAQAPDFYIEMKWEFTSWVPLISRICPSDTYKVWKSGSNVRIDTTLLGFDNMSWQRGNRSFLFKLSGDTTSLLEVDYDNCQVFAESLSASEEPPSVSYMRPSDDSVALRLTSPLVTTYVDVDKISFERSKSGIWGWRSDKVDVIDNFNCKVFSATNVSLTTKTRTEHLSEEDKRKIKKQSRSPFESLLGYAEADPASRKEETVSNFNLSRNPSDVAEEDYFKEGSLSADIGRPIEENVKVQKLKARFWLCEDYPLSLPDQILPIIDLMASSNTHFRKLKDFIALQLPSGFPVKIEIPLFHVLNANIIFGNLLSRDKSVEGVTLINNGAEPMSCIIDDSMFNVPTSYSVIGDTQHERLQDEDEQLYQFTLRQSLLQQHNADNNMRRANSHYVDIASEEDRLLQWALEESLKESRSLQTISKSSSSPPLSPPTPSLSPPLASLSSPPNYCNSDFDEDMKKALELSEKESEEERKKKEEEEKEMMMVMDLSLKEK